MFFSKKQQVYFPVFANTRLKTLLSLYEGKSFSNLYDDYKNQQKMFVVKKMFITKPQFCSNSIIISIIWQSAFHRTDVLYVLYDGYHVSVLQICIVGQQLLHHLNMALLGGRNQGSPAILCTRQKVTEAWVNA